MSRFPRQSAWLLFLFCTASCLMGQQASAQQAPQSETASADTYYGEDLEQTEEKSIARLKSIKRGEQRMARLEAMRWYGFSASRPTASAMPFTTMYSPAWTRPGGRPFAWYTGHRQPPAPRYGYYYRYR